MARYHFQRLVKTPYSEIYLIWQGHDRIGQLDLHYARETIHGTAILERDLDEQARLDLWRQIDHDIVLAYLPEFEREDFYLTFWRGEEIETHNDQEGMDEEFQDPFSEEE